MHEEIINLEFVYLNLFYYLYVNTLKYVWK